MINDIETRTRTNTNFSQILQSEESIKTEPIKLKKKTNEEREREKVTVV